MESLSWISHAAKRVLLAPIAAASSATSAGVGVGARGKQISAAPMGLG